MNTSNIRLAHQPVFGANRMLIDIGWLPLGALVCIVVFAIIRIRIILKRPIGYKPPVREPWFIRLFVAMIILFLGILIGIGASWSYQKLLEPPTVPSTIAPPIRA